jgi:hypothetical protein
VGYISFSFTIDIIVFMPFQKTSLIGLYEK